MFNYNGPGFKGLFAGDVVEFHTAGRVRKLRAAVLPLLVFDTHVQVRYTPHGYTVDASNFVRLVRRGKRHIAADKKADELLRNLPDALRARLESMHDD
jgi:hypothetical protein